MALNITINDTAAGIGQYYRQFGRDFFKKLYQNIEGEMHMTPIPGITDEYVTTAGDIGDILKPYNSAFTPGAEMEYTPLVNKVRSIAGDILISDLKDLQRRYLGWLAQHDGYEANFEGYIEFIMKDYIFPKLREEIDTMSFKGEYNAVGTGFLDCVDGWGKIVDDAVTAGDIVPIPTGAITGANIFDKVEEFMDAIPDSQRGTAADGVLVMSYSNFVAYFRDLRGQGFNVSNFTQNNPNGPVRQFVQPYGVEIVGLKAMNGSDLFMYTPKSNWLKLYNEIDVPESFEAQKYERSVKLMMDFVRGYGFGRIDCVWVNDQAAIPA